MASHEADATGDVLEQVRTLVGPDVPVVGTLDLHANVTQRMVQHATALIGYHTAPHVDMFETGQKAAQVLTSIIRGRMAPTSALVRLPMLLPPENSTHSWGPLAEVINLALEMERSGKIVHASIYPVQPWMDTGDVAASVLVVMDDDVDTAQAVARSLAEKFWSLRHEFKVERTAPDVAIRRSLDRTGGTVILCDSADSTTSGSTGDSTAILSALLRCAPVDEVALANIVDPLVVARAIEAGVGTTIDVKIGGSPHARVLRAGRDESVHQDHLRRGLHVQGSRHARRPAPDGTCGRSPLRRHPPSRHGASGLAVGSTDVPQRWRGAFRGENGPGEVAHGISRRLRRHLR